MPWLSIIMALVSFFLAGGSKPENRAKAAAIGLAAGAATYGVTHYTDWGRENLGRLDGVTVSGGGEGASNNNKVPTATTADGKPITLGNNSAGAAGSTGLFSAIGGALANPVVAGATGLAVGSSLNRTTLMWIAIGLGVFLILKD